MFYWLKVFTTPRHLIIFLQGFSSGLPLLLVGGTFRVWMSESGVDLTTIGLFAYATSPYTLKFLWAPFVDRFVIRPFGRRRGWMILFQFGLMISLLLMAMTDPATQLLRMALFTFIASFFAASQDIVIDAYRRDFLPEDELGFGTSMTMTGYRFGLLAAGSLALILADQVTWAEVYGVMAGLTLVGILTTLFCPEPQVESQPRDFKEAVIDPFVDYFKKNDALIILAFILLYKIGDSMASDLLNLFYRDVGFTKTQIGLVSKPVAIWANIAGGLVGGLMMLKLGLRRSLWSFGILQAVSTLTLAALSLIGPNLWALGGVVFFETFSGGMGSAAYGAFMLSLTNKKFSATQYALLSSFMALPRMVLGSTTGWLVEHLGWSWFYVLCTLAAVPGMLLLLRFRKWDTGNSIPANFTSDDP